MRLSAAHDRRRRGVRLWRSRRALPPPASIAKASTAVARAHGLDPTRTLFVQQSDAAIAAGAFSTYVVAVASRRVLFCHEQAFADAPGFYADLRRRCCRVIVEVPAARVPLADAIASYLFNAQLVTLPDGVQALVLPEEARATPSVWNWLQEHRERGPITRSWRWSTSASRWQTTAAPPACPARVAGTRDDRPAVPGGRGKARPDCRSFTYWPETIAHDAIAGFGSDRGADPEPREQRCSKRSGN